MENIVDNETLRNFKHRYKMRLELLKAPLGSTIEEFEELKEGLAKLTKTVISKSELDAVLDGLKQYITPVNAHIDEQILVLENIESATWQELSEFQERFFSLNILAYQQSLDFQQNLSTELGCVLEIAMKKAKSTARAKAPKEQVTTPLQDPKSEAKYSTSAMKAMEAAIEFFWLEYDAKSPPTQKQVSNFIAEQISEPIRNRFTDELARAIKPENV